MDAITSIAQRVAVLEAAFTAPAASTIASTVGSTRTPVVADSGARFDRVLSAVVEGATGAGRARTVDGVPSDLAAHGNGRIPRAALQEVGTTGHRLWAPAGQALESLMAAAAREGVQIGITDSYRSFDAQVDVAQRKGLYSQGGLAAEPGTSPHGWGLAVDLDLDGRAQAWMRANAGRFGFVEDTPREPWHWVYKS
ncbi:M15 family metallopeptidase [Oerskovia turbata]